MQPITFKEQTNVLARAQPQYRVLPVCVQRYEEEGVKLAKMTCKYRLTNLELEQIIRTKSIYISQFGNCFHPIFPQVESPFEVCKVLYRLNEDNTYTFWVPMNEQPEIIINNIPLNKAVEEITLMGKITAEQILFIPKPSLGIDADGNLKMM